MRTGAVSAGHLIELTFAESEWVFKELLVETNKKNWEFIQKLYLFLYLNSTFLPLGFRNIYSWLH